MAVNLKNLNKRRTKMKKLGLFLIAIGLVFLATQALAKPKAGIPLPKAYQVGNFWVYHFYYETFTNDKKPDKIIKDTDGDEVKLVVAEGEVETKIVKIEQKGYFNIITLKSEYRPKIKNETSEEAKNFASPKDFLAFNSSTGDMYACDQEKLKELLAGKNKNLEPEYVFDLKVGQKWGEDKETKRTDDMYCNFVEKIEAVKVPAGLFKKCFKIVYYTNPDHSIRWFSPDVGLIKEEYVHHGTPNNYKTELKKFGKKK